MSCRLTKIGGDWTEVCQSKVSDYNEDWKDARDLNYTEGGPILGLLCNLKCFFTMSDADYNAYQNICTCMPKGVNKLFNYRGK